MLLILPGCRVWRVHRAAAAIKAAMNPTRVMPGPTTVLPVVINHAMKQSTSQHWRSPLQNPTALIPGHNYSSQSESATIAKQQTWLDLQCTVPGPDSEKSTLSWVILRVSTLTTCGLILHNRFRRRCHGHGIVMARRQQLSRPHTHVLSSLR